MAIGYFTNLPLTFVGGLLVGVASALVDKYSATISWVGGLPPAVDSVTAGYGDTTVLRSVDLTVGDGMVVALLGPNGAGKTTLLRTATAGLGAADAGAVEGLPH